MVSGPFNVTIYGKTNCPHCSNAKLYCDAQDMVWQYKELDKDFTREEILEQFPSAKSFPIVVFNNTWIGGYTDLIREHKRALGYETD